MTYFSLLYFENNLIFEIVNNKENYIPSHVCYFHRLIVIHCTICSDCEVHSENFVIETLTTEHNTGLTETSSGTVFVHRNIKKTLCLITLCD